MDQHQRTIMSGTSYADNIRSQRSESPRQRKPPSPRGEDWTTWPEVTIKLSGLPSTATTLDIYEMVREEGEVVRIDFVDDQQGALLGDAFVAFSPPPRRPFWRCPEDWKIEQWNDSGDARVNHGLTMQLKPKQRMTWHPSPTIPGKMYPERQMLYLAKIQMGFMYQPGRMMTMHSVPSTSYCSVKLTLNLQRREMVIEFPVHLPKSEQHRNSSRPELVRFHIPIHQMTTFWETQVSAYQKAVTFTLDNPPAFYQRANDVMSTFEDSRHWHERYRWWRLTELQRCNGSRCKESDDLSSEPWPLSLKKSDKLIDIGRWTTYRILIDNKGSCPKHYSKIKEILTDYNVKFCPSDQLETVIKTGNTVWDWIDRPNHQPSISFLEEMSSGVIDLKWPLRYQLESCISLGILNERNITRDFILQLNSVPEQEAIIRLEIAADGNKRIFEPSDIFLFPLRHSHLSRKIPSYCVLQRAVTITPTTVYYSTPDREMSNRVLRLFQEHADRFIRVRFTGEKFEGRIHATDEITEDAVFTRVYNCLTRGLTIGDRHFEFVAMGNSQFREHGAYFFASTPTLTASHIRARLGQIGKYQDGKFIAENIVAKYTSRLGQCFSTTRPIRSTNIKVVEIPDVERNGYTFTDGVGMISPFLVQLIAWDLQIPGGPNELPSAFQFRMGGIKGVVAVSKRAKKTEMLIRPSQYKFPALYEGLEIIRWSYFSIARLNRQLIGVLRALGVPGAVFMDKLQTELQLLDEAMTNGGVAESVLRQHVDYNQMTLILANMIADGFMNSRDPFCMSVLHLWRAWRTKQLREKAALTVSQGAFLLGCTDETQTLRGHTAGSEDSQATSTEQKAKTLPQIFVQITDPERPWTFKVIQGLCIVARNPSLHPGDIRVVEAVDIPRLHHLRDVVVFPQTGDRDVPGMCSGGDLDGDDFVVIWDSELIPPLKEWDTLAMDFTPPPPRRKMNGEIDVQDVVSFFVTYMRTDKLRTIAHSHLANADFYPQGVKHPKCLELARLHSIAVDYPKSGIPAPPIHKLRPVKYPHFMVNNTRPKYKYYHSGTILGKLYDAVPQVNFQPILHYPFDNRVLEAFQLEQDLLDKAATIKKEYDAAMRRIMAQHKIGTEFEVWTTFVMQHAQNSNDYKFGEELGQIATSLKDQFVERCRECAGGKDYDTLAPFVAAMYTVTANEVTSALQVARERATNIDLEDAPVAIALEDVPFMSFPWLFPRELGKLAQGPRAAMVKETTSSLVGVYQPQKSRDPFEFDKLDRAVDEIVSDGKVTGRGDILELFQNVDAIKRPEQVTMEEVMEDVEVTPGANGTNGSIPGAFDEEMEDGEITD